MEKLNRLNDQIASAAAAAAGSEAAMTPRGQACLVALYEASDMLEAETGKTKKVNKIIKRFVSYLDYQVKHSTGGAHDGYSTLLGFARSY